jgi:hypothetical protein
MKKNDDERVAETGDTCANCDALIKEVKAEKSHPTVGAHETGFNWGPFALQIFLILLEAWKKRNEHN